MKTITEIEEEFDEQKLGHLNWCGNEDHECECSVKVEEIKSFYRKQIKGLLKGLKIEEIHGENWKGKFPYQKPYNDLARESNNEIDKIIKDL